MTSESKEVIHVAYEDADFIDKCYQALEAKKDVLVTCDRNRIRKCRRAASAFFSFQISDAKGIKRLAVLGHLAFLGLQVPPLMAVCNKAYLLGVSAIVQSSDNDILLLSR